MSLCYSESYDEFKMKAMENLQEQEREVIKHDEKNDTTEEVELPKFSEITQPEIVKDVVHIDNEAVEYTDLQQVSKELLCPICKYPFTEPTDTPCGHTFCKDCIISWLRCSTKCPQDHIPCPPQSLVASNRIIKNQVDNLLVFCLNKAAGCNEKIERQFLQTHCAKYCPKTEFECPYRCHFKDSRTKVKAHIKVCGERKVQCECGSLISFHALDLHWRNICPLFGIKCVFCRGNHLRQEKNQHMKSCVEVIVECNYKEFGCEFKGPRKSLDQHVIDHCSYGKVNGLCEHYKTLKEEVLLLRSFRSNILETLQTFTYKIQYLEKCNNERERRNQKHDTISNNSDSHANNNPIDDHRWSYDSRRDSNYGARRSRPDVRRSSSSMDDRRHTGHGNHNFDNYNKPTIHSQQSNYRGNSEMSNNDYEMTQLNQYNPYSRRHLESRTLGNSNDISHSQGQSRTRSQDQNRNHPYSSNNNENNDTSEMEPERQRTNSFSSSSSSRYAPSLRRNTSLPYSDVEGENIDTIIGHGNHDVNDVSDKSEDEIYNNNSSNNNNSFGVVVGDDDDGNDDVASSFADVYDYGLVSFDDSIDALSTRTRINRALYDDDDDDIFDRNSNISTDNNDNNDNNDNDRNNSNNNGADDTDINDFSFDLDPVRRRRVATKWNRFIKRYQENVKIVEEARVNSIYDFSSQEDLPSNHYANARLNADAEPSSSTAHLPTSSSTVASGTASIDPNRLEQLSLQYPKGSLPAITKKNNSSSSSSSSSSRQNNGSQYQELVKNNTTKGGNSSKNNFHTPRSRFERLQIRANAIEEEFRGLKDYHRSTWNTDNTTSNDNDSNNDNLHSRNFLRSRHNRHNNDNNSSKARIRSSSPANDVGDHINPTVVDMNLGDNVNDELLKSDFDLDLNDSSFEFSNNADLLSDSLDPEVYCDVLLSRLSTPSATSVVTPERKEELRDRLRLHIINGRSNDNNGSDTNNSRIK